ncbi:helix-turn-helix domain-containing protein [Thalassotalea atypica]|uniref:helix-turn-helix domain-containing protein n=1 Tax=Thalassotalea atypica TaxID=2054316 RepID=UPI00257481A4|nr:helix-turn-helix domain-containing protein [Thalassotalea atypica]
MIHWLHRPKSPLVAMFVECYWMIEKKHGAERAQFPKLNPDPSAHLIISPATQPYSYDVDGVCASGVGSHLLFPYLHTYQLDHSQPFIHLGIKFKVGALYSAVLPNQSHPRLNQIEPINFPALILQTDLNISCLLNLARSNEKACSERLDNLLVPWLSQFKPDRYSELTSRALQILDSAVIAEMGKTLHCSQRTLERTFSKVTGITLKQCQSMNRLEAMLEYLAPLSKEEINWVDVAFKFGFSDQPHLIRYLKSQLGLTPNTYAKERGLTIDIYGGITGLKAK